MKSWPHAPSREIGAAGTYIITAATQYKRHLFNSPEKLDLLEKTLLASLDERGWQVQAWACFTNHYHFIGISPTEGLGLSELTRHIHGITATELNRIDETAGRVVWFRCWDTRLTYEKSYLARLAYVHTNPVKHGLVRAPEDYEWCSAAWFALRAPRPFRESVLSFKTDKVNVIDDFEPAFVGR